MRSEQVAFVKRLVLVNAAVPLALLGLDAARGDLGANPVELVLRSTGTLALTFLALSLAVTPARQLLGAPWLIRIRRMLGLLCFAYASLHVSLYLALDQSFDLLAVARDAVTRPFISFGMLAFGLLLPLAWTSTDAAMRRLGKRWTRLHRRVTWVALFAVAHYWLEVKADITKPAVFAAIFGLLLFWRFVHRDVPKPAKG